MIRPILPMLLGALALAPGAALAHGTGWRLTTEKAVVVELYYANGEQMPFADVRVFAPGDAATPVLHGRADGRGRAAFVPDRDGVWTLAASDGDGHGLQAAIPVTLGGALGAVEVPARASAELRLALIASVLANVGLLLWGWTRVAGRRDHPGQVAPLVLTNSE